MAIDYLEVIRTEAAALRAVVAGADLEARVPSCPDWSLRDLVAHVGRTHRFHTGNVQRGVTDPPTFDALPVPPEDDHALLLWLDEGVEDMLAVLARLDPDGPAWNWSLDPQVASFWPRRMALETAVHRWDAELALGKAQPFAPELAADGVDEVLRVHLPADRHDADEEEQVPDPHAGRVRVSASDHPGDWLVTLRPDGADVTGGPDGGGAEHGADATVRGPLFDLFLAVWGRLDVDRLEVTGDPDLARAIHTS